MAATKLTLSVKPDSLPLVKKYAKRKHTSVSKLVQQFFDSIVEEEKGPEDPFLKRIREMEIPDDIKALTGILKGKVPDNINLWDAKYEYLKEKYDL
ncbi:MAG: hypothetical protein JWQ66_4105 [Mucilaginibacter sp.]|nr:hypothetical protein [Mucilaginibacter sp.]